MKDQPAETIPERYGSSNQRQKGSALPRRWYVQLPPDSVPWLRLEVLFNALWEDDEIGPEIISAFAPVATAWAESFPEVSLSVRRLGNEFIQRWFKIDNPSLLQVFLTHYYVQSAESMKEEARVEASRLGLDSIESTSLQYEWMVWNSPPLNRPRDRKRGQYYGAVKRSKRMRGFQRIDIGSMSRFAEAWIAVKLDLVPSLAEFVRRQHVRKYRQKDDSAGFSQNNREINWRRGVRLFDEALGMDWSVPHWPRQLGGYELFNQLWSMELTE